MKDGDSGNEGIQVSGGSFNVSGALAVGRNAHAASSHQVAGTSMEDLLEQLDGLREAVQRNAAELENSAAATADLRRLLTELEEPEPELERVNTLLDRLRTAAGHVVEIATGLTAVEHLVAVVL
jgi:chromosome segregation ATPase